MPKHAATRKPKPIARPRGAKPNIINRAPSPGWVNGWRDKIRTTHLIDRLQRFCLDDPDNPISIRMTRTQAMVALSLLRKVLPDMQSLEISGNADQPITVQVLRFSDPADPSDGHGSNGSAPALGARPGEPLTIDVAAEPVNVANPLQSLALVESNPRLIEDEPIASHSQKGRRARS